MIRRTEARSRTAAPVAWLIAALVVAHACACPGSGAVIGEGDAGDGGQADAGGADGGPLPADAGDGGGGSADCPLPLAGRGTALVSGLNGPRHLALDPRGLYVTEAGQIGLDNGRLLRVPLDGGAAIPLLTNLAAPDALAADGIDLWALDANALWRINSATLAQGVLGTPVNDAYSGRTDLEVLPGDVLIASGERGLARIPKDGGTARFLYLGDAGEQIPEAEVRGGLVYFMLAGTTRSPGIYRVPLTGGAAVRVHPVTEGHSLTLVPGGLLWSEGKGGAGAVNLDPLDGGLSSALVGGLEGPVAPLFVQGVLYLRDGASAQPASARTFLAVPACAPEGLAVGPVVFGPGDLLFDGTALFYSSPGINQQGSVGVVP